MLNQPKRALRVLQVLRQPMNEQAGMFVLLVTHVNKGRHKEISSLRLPLFSYIGCNFSYIGCNTSSHIFNLSMPCSGQAAILPHLHPLMSP